MKQRVLITLGISIFQVGLAASIGYGTSLRHMSTGLSMFVIVVVVVPITLIGRKLNHQWLQ